MKKATAKKSTKSSKKVTKSKSKKPKSKLSQHNKEVTEAASDDYVDPGKNFDPEQTELYNHMESCEQEGCQRFGVVVLTDLYPAEYEIPQYVAKWSKGIKNFNCQLIKYWHLIEGYRYKNTGKTAPAALFIYYEGDHWKKIQSFFRTLKSSHYEASEIIKEVL